MKENTENTENTAPHTPYTTSLDYELFLTIVRDRKEHIEELSMEDENYNREWNQLKLMEDSLWKLVKIAQ